MFSLEELVGTVDVINKAIGLRNGLDGVGDEETRLMLTELQDGFLETPRDKVRNGENVKFPISYVTDVVGRALRTQRGEDQSRKRKMEADDATREQKRFEQA